MWLQKVECKLCHHMYFYDDFCHDYDDGHHDDGSAAANGGGFGPLSLHLFL